MPELVPGAVLPNIGIRVLGSVERVDPLEDEGIAPRKDPLASPPPVTVDYVVAGTVERSRDFQVDVGAGPQHAGVELVLTVNGHLLQAQVDGQARDIEPGSRLILSGELVVIGEYEWEAFDLVDTRAPWSVEETRRVSNGDYLLRLVPAPQSW
ncbi:hypothetical protein JOF29_007512 [Kribbella aluminosa]|uniref:FHA domain-containing protein n=1 Tax=Kribbella aluminosa TaxID=416017 RepID=A0ABS4UXR7_9ACTN|nr:hypothetical protein [Kribbella aluminosa]MBP2356402.1 hypothetical protein [Kribbella aluminosa]